MELVECVRWGSGFIDEVYFDEISYLVIMKSGPVVKVQKLEAELPDILLVDDKAEQVLLQPFNQLRINLVLEMIAGLTLDSKLVIFQYKPYKRFRYEMKNKKVLGFSFIEKKARCSFYVVFKSSLCLYRFKKDSLKLVSKFEVDAVEYAFEVKQGFLAIVSSDSRVFIYFLYESKKHNFVGPSFDLSVDKSIIRAISSGPKGQNLLNYTGRLDCNQVYFFKIYEFSYFIHLDNLNGRIYLFWVLKDLKVQVLKCYKISQGIYGIALCDNLLVVQNYNTQESLIFDIKDKEENLSVVSHSEVRKAGEVGLELNSGHLFLDANLVSDLQENSIKQLKLNPAELVKNHPECHRAILFLLRRDDYKVHVLEKLKKSLMELIPLQSLKKVFKVLAVEYAKAQETHNASSSINRVEKISLIQPSDSDSFIDMKNENGFTVLLQSDLYNYVFYQVYTATSDKIYFSKSLICLTHQFIQLDIPIQYSIQFLLFKTLIEIQDFSTVETLISVNFFTDSYEIAYHLIALANSKKFPFSFLLGIDMLQRLNLSGDLTQSLSDSDFLYEALSFCSTKNVDPEMLLEMTQKFTLAINK